MELKVMLPAKGGLHGLRGYGRDGREKAQKTQKEVERQDGMAMVFDSGVIME